VVDSRVCDSLLEFDSCVLAANVGRLGKALLVVVVLRVCRILLLLILKWHGTLLFLHETQGQFRSHCQLKKKAGLTMQFMQD